MLLLHRYDLHNSRPWFLARLFSLALYLRLFTRFGSLWLLPRHNNGLRLTSRRLDGRGFCNRSRLLPTAAAAGSER